MYRRAQLDASMEHVLNQRPVAVMKATQERRAILIVHQTVGDPIAIKCASVKTIPRAMPRTEAVPARRGTEVITANSSAHLTVLDRIVPRFANARTMANVIQFPASATVRLVSRGLCVQKGVQRVSTENSVGRNVAARMVEAAIHRRVSVFVRPVIPERYVLIAARANGTV